MKEMEIFTELSDMTYKEVLNNLTADKTSFVCESCSKFLISLEEDGYTEYLYTRSQNDCNLWHKRKERSSDACEPTSRASTGYIYVDKIDGYYNIEIENIGTGKYDIEIIRRQTEQNLRTSSKSEQALTVKNNIESVVKDKADRCEKCPMIEQCTYNAGSKECLIKVQSYNKAVEDVCTYLTYEWSLDKINTCSDFERVANMLHLQELNEEVTYEQ